MKYKFHKEYSRDNSMILQEAWFKALSELENINFEPNPHNPNSIFFINRGLVEIWENHTATNLVKEIILKRNFEDPEYLKNGIVLHENNLEEVKIFADKEILESPGELKKFSEIAYKTIASFLIFYFTALNEKTPENLRKLAFEIRDKDVFFTVSHKIIRKTLAYLYPYLKGYETVVLTSEIENPPSLETLKERWMNSVIIPGITNEIISLEQFAKNNSLYEFDFDEVTDSKELRGQTAQKGIAQGIVKIVRLRDEVAKVEGGDIIVSPMTMPDYLPAMQKAAAFVTDEGGITCHAAIVARELKKPCIIGTKIATKVLQDGDLVEVDAERGIVAVIKRSDES